MDYKLSIDSIKEKGLDLDRELPMDDVVRMLDVKPPTLFAADSASRLHARFEKVNDRDIVAKGSFEVKLASPCKRCLKPVTVKVPVKFELDFVDEGRLEELAARAAGDDEGEGEISASFDPTAADQIGYRGKELDLFPVLQEQLLLALPETVACGPDCKGLCAVCGKDKNVETCSCDPHVPDPRWAALKNVKLS